MKNRKKLKGMTLVEVIIAMAVFAMLGVVLLGAGKVIDNTTKASSRLNKKMSAQAPYAAAKNVVDYNEAEDINGDGVVDNADKYYYEDDNGNKTPVTPESMNISVYFEDSSQSDGIARVKVQKYEKDASGNVLRDPVTNEPIKAYERNVDGSIKTDPVTGNPIISAPVDEKAESDMNAKGYSTKAVVEGNSEVYDPNGPNANLNFRFIKIEP